MNRKLAACLVALALLVAWLVVQLTGGRGDGARGSERGAAPAPVASAAPAVLEADAPLATLESVTREATQPRSTGPVSRAERGELAGLSGRVVENDGAPVPGMRVALLEFDANLLFDGSAIDAPPQTAELEETVTDEEGRFLLGGARSTAFHALGLDLAGPRATLRLIDHALPHRERTDIGDVVLAPYGILTGSVVDETGAPVAGARIRAGPFPKEILQVPVYEFRSTSRVSVNLSTLGGEGQRVLELPSWVDALVDRLPIPTTTSAADGTFRLVGVALGEIVGGVDKPGLVGVPLGPVTVTGEHDLGALVLKNGRTIRGVVEDSFGEPQAGVEVLAGAEIVPGIVAILQPCGKTDAEGRFELGGVADAGQVVAAARRAEHEAFGTTVTAQHENVLIELEPIVQLTVLVRDTDQKPISGARIQLAPAAKPMERGFGEVLMFLRGPSTRAELVHEVEPGRYVITGLGSGLYDVTARVKGLAPGFVQAQCTAEENEVTVICAVGSRLELTVLDGATKEPVTAAKTSVLHAGASGFVQLAAESTDADGHAWLGPLPPRESAPANPGFPSETMLAVRHPRYAEFSIALPPEAPLSGPMTVTLQSGGSLAGRVHWGGAVPTRLYMVTLEYRGADGFLEAFHLPRFTLSDLAGEFRCTQLIAGTYQVELSERFLDKDPAGMFRGDFDPTTVHTEEIEIREGETTQLVIDLTPTGRGPTARVVGRVRVDGRPLEGAEVQISGNEGLKVVTDSSGRFETQQFSVIRSSHLQIEGEVALAGGEKQRTMLHEETLELANGDVKEVELDLYPLSLPVRTVDAISGQSVADVQVTVQGTNEERSWRFRQYSVQTNSAGEVTLLVLKPGDYMVSASAGGFGRSSASVKVPAEGLREPTLVRLKHAVPCAGRVVIDAAQAGEGGFAYVQVQEKDGANSSGARIQAPDFTFEIDGLTEGKYEAWAWFSGKRWKDVSFELGPEGARDLELVFVNYESPGD
jgi:carboxypeptidase family protein